MKFVLPRLKTGLPYFVIGLFGLMAVQPLFGEALICADDLFPHIHKAHALERLIAQGHLVPRWSPDMSRGYGYPLFNFYAPFSSYPLVLIHWLGFSYLQAIQLLLGACLFGAGVGMFWLAREMFDDGAGLTAAIAYMFAPYLGYDIFFRGALAEVTGWVWIPLAMWAMRRATIHRSWRWCTVAAVFYGLLLPSHNLLALLATPLLIGWAVALALSGGALPSARYGLAAVALGLGLAAYFWIPALAERGEVRLDRVLDPPLLRYWTNFISIKELLATPYAVDRLLINPSPPRALGLIPAVLCLPAVWWALRRSDHNRLAILYLAISLSAYAVMTLSISQPVWDRVSLLSFVQFPWRMLTPAAVCAALLIGSTARRISHLRWASPALGVTLALTALPWFQPTYCGPLAYADEQLRAGTFQEGAHDYSEYLPASVNAFPPDDSLFLALVAGGSPERLQTDAVVQSTTGDALDARYEVQASQPTAATYRQFYYPGWQATLNSKPLSVVPHPESGLITLAIPQGSYELRVFFGETPLRQTANGISWVALALCVFMLMLAQRAGGWRPSHTAPLGQFVLAGLLALAMKTYWPDSIPNPFIDTKFDGATVQGTSPLSVRLAGGVAVVGFDAPSAARSGESLDVVLYAGISEPVDRRWVPSIAIDDSNGVRWSDTQIDFPRWLRAPYTPDAWQPGQYALWGRHVQILPGTPPGVYSVWGGAFDANTLIPDSVIDDMGNPTAPRFHLTDIVIDRPTRPAGVHSLGIEHPLNISFNDRLILLGGTADRADARPGDTMWITLFWTAPHDPGQDFAAQLHLIAADGSVAHSQAIALVNHYPTSQWRRGDVWRGQHLARLPAGLESTTYRWAVTVDGSPHTAEFGKLTVAAPDRLFSQPAFAAAADGLIGGFAQLTGYTLSAAHTSPGETLSLALIWRATQTPAESYAVFVHLADVQGRVWAQADGVPQNWARPTTGWVEGEYIVDERTLTLPDDAPAGEYTLYVGMADLASGARAPVQSTTATPELRLPLATLTVTSGK